MTSALVIEKAPGISDADPDGSQGRGAPPGRRRMTKNTSLGCTSGAKAATTLRYRKSPCPIRHSMEQALPGGDTRQQQDAKEDKRNEGLSWLLPCIHYSYGVQRPSNV